MFYIFAVFCRDITPALKYEYHSGENLGEWQVSVVCFFSSTGYLNSQTTSNYFVRVIPTLTNYSDIVSDIPS
jgi:hypothetical protein